MTQTLDGWTPIYGARQLPRAGDGGTGEGERVWHLRDHVRHSVRNHLHATGALQCAADHLLSIARRAGLWQAPPRPGAGPPMYWYGWLINSITRASVVGLIATAVPAQWLRRATVFCCVLATLWVVVHALASFLNEWAYLQLDFLDSYWLPAIPAFLGAAVMTVRGPANGWTGLGETLCCSCRSPGSSSSDTPTTVLHALAAPWFGAEGTRAPSDRADRCWRKAALAPPLSLLPTTRASPFVANQFAAVERCAPRSFISTIEYFKSVVPTCVVSRFRSKHSRMARKCSSDPRLM